MSGLPIQSIHIRNYKCHRDVKVAFEPLTVLIGKNDTGKSSVLEVIDLVGRADPAQFDIKSLAANHSYESARDSVSVAVISRSDSFTLFSSTAMPTHIREKIGPFAGPYQLNVSAMRKPAQTFALQGLPLPPNGENLVDALDRLSHNRFGELQKSFIQRIPTILEILREPVKPGQKQLFFRLAGGGKVSAEKVSDGPLLLLAFLTIVYDEATPSLVMIEEPENGVHPRQLEHIVRFMSEMTRRESPVQVILTTHSPYLLDFVPQESVRVFTRGVDGHTHVYKMTESAHVRDLLKKGYTMGEVWYNTDEDELLTQKEKQAS